MPPKNLFDNEFYLSDKPLDIVCSYDVWQSYFFASEDDIDHQTICTLLDKLQFFLEAGYIKLHILGSDFFRLCTEVKGLSIEDVEIFCRMVNIIKVNPVYFQYMEELEYFLSLEPELALLLACADLNRFSVVLHSDSLINNPTEPIIFEDIKICSPSYLLTTAILSDLMLEMTQKLPQDTYLDELPKWIDNHESRIVCGVDVRVLMEVKQNSLFAYNLINRVDLLIASGTPVMWMSGLEKSMKERDLFSKYITYCADKNKRVLLIGDQDETLRKVEEQLQLNAKYSTIDLLPSLCLPSSLELSISQIHEINGTLKPDVIFLSLPHPRQEMWLCRHYQAFQTTVIGVSSAFQFYGGDIPKPSDFVQAMGLEWLIHYISDPDRLGASYRKAIPLFLKIPSFSSLIIRQMLFHDQQVFDKPSITNYPEVDCLLKRIRSCFSPSSEFQQLC